MTTAKRPPMPGPGPMRLDRVPMRPIEWSADCPACGHPFIIHDGMIEETTAGSFVVTDADRYPRCEECDTQFEIAEMSVEATDA